MKKREKRIYTIKMIRNSINDFMRRHPMFTKEYCDSWCYFGCRNNGYCSNCNSANDCHECKSECKCKISDFMISFYDHDNELIVSNWLSNSGSYNPANSKLINEMAKALDVDIQHLMWDEADKFLHTVRYICIGMRNLIKDENGYEYYIETGVKYDIYGKVVERYRSKWYSNPLLNNQYNAGIF